MTGYAFTDTAKRLAMKYCNEGRFTGFETIIDRDGNPTHVELTTRGGDFITIATFVEDGEEQLMFTSYISTGTAPHNTGSVHISQVDTLLTGLSRFYSA